jgi:hypothetical protein
VSDLSVDVGPEQVIAAAERDGVRVAVLVDGECVVNHNETLDVLNDLGLELGHVAYVGSQMLENRGFDADELDEQPEIVTDGGVATPGLNRLKLAGAAAAVGGFLTFAVTVGWLLSVFLALNHPGILDVARNGWVFSLMIGELGYCLFLLGDSL